MTGWSVRPLAPADASAVLGVIQAAFRAQSVPTDPPSNALRETAESIAGLIAAGGGAAVVATGGDLAAVLLWQEKPGGALYLGRLAVLPAWRRRGLARVLVAAAEARRRGLVRLTLGVRVELLDNQALFAACGFVETGRSSHPGYARPTSIDMEKRLG